MQTLYLPWNFNQFLATTMKQEIKVVHRFYLWMYRSRDGHCIDIINDMVLEFNFAMRFMVEELNHELPGADIIFCDVFEASMDIIKNHDYYGFNVTTDACCGLGR
ncbi:hypothetical protein Leryth_014526 [Lithospermum erythrorhizon]|nr:hypothetical protein Leryth_014526 [Lithospermum erythrorhizon]